MRNFPAAALLRQSEQVRESQRKRNIKHYQKNREEILARKAKYYQDHRDEVRSRQRFCQRKVFLTRKLDILTYYGGGKCACVKCGESRLACLSIDHINGGGTQHIKQVGIGSNFYRWLKNSGYPEGYQTLCMNCQWVKRVENNEGIK